MVTLINIGILYFTHELITAALVIRREHFYKKATYIPPTLFFSRDRARYVDWRGSH